MIKTSSLLLLVGALAVVAHGQGLEDFRIAYRAYDECSGSLPCLKLKLIAGLDRAARRAELNVIDGLSLVREGDAPEAMPLDEASLPRSLGEKDEALDRVIQDRFVQFFNTHKVQFRLSDLDLSGRSIDEEGNY